MELTNILLACFYDIDCCTPHKVNFLNPQVLHDVVKLLRTLKGSKSEEVEVEYNRKLLIL